MSIVCEHPSYVEQNFTHSSNHEQSFTLKAKQTKGKILKTSGILNSNNERSFEVAQ